MDQSYPEPLAGGAELQLPTRREVVNLNHIVR
jgi:hypothetical protein